MSTNASPNLPQRKNLIAQVYVRHIVFVGEETTPEESWTSSFVSISCTPDATARDVALQALAKSLVKPMLLADVLLADMDGVPLPQRDPANQQQCNKSSASVFSTNPTMDDSMHQLSQSHAKTGGSSLLPIVMNVGDAFTDPLTFQPLPWDSTASSWRQMLQSWEQTPDHTGALSFCGHHYKIPSRSHSPLIPLLVVTRPSFEVAKHVVQATYRILHRFAYQAAGRVQASSRRALRQQHTALNHVRAEQVAAIEEKQKHSERAAILKCYGPSSKK